MKRIRHASAALVLLVIAFVQTSCATVAQNRRKRLADPMMSIGDEPTEAYRKQKLYTTREGAAGGDGATAGGGCSCQ
jgi:hypothetical protein